MHVEGLEQHWAEGHQCQTLRGSREGGAPDQDRESRKEAGLQEKAAGSVWDRSVRAAEGPSTAEGMGLRLGAEPTGWVLPILCRTTGAWDGHT